jgi:hypothetical protein
MRIRLFWPKAKDKAFLFTSPTCGFGVNNFTDKNACLERNAGFR